MSQSRVLPKALALTGLIAAGLLALRSVSVREVPSIDDGRSAKIAIRESVLPSEQTSTVVQNWDALTKRRNLDRKIEENVEDSVPKFSGLQRGQQERLAEVTTAERFDALSDTHRRMLANLAREDSEIPGIVNADGVGGGSPGGQGIVTRPFVCFAPGTPAELREPFSAMTGQGQVDGALASGLQALALQTSSRWSSTATDGFGTGTSGDPLTLTWSIVSDGLSIPGSNGEPTSDSNLRAWLDGIYGSEANWLPIFQSVFDRWEELTGITYVYESSDDGRNFPSTSGRSGKRGDIRIAGHPIDGSFNVLAYNFFPSNGDMVIDTSDGYFSSTSGNSLRLRNTVAHEHGHGLGLQHVCPINQTKLMEPNLTLAFDGPQHDEIFSAQRLYGDRFENDDSFGSANGLGALTTAGALVENVSIASGSDVDFLEFEAPGGEFELDLTLRPIGSSYLEGEQTSTTCTGTTFNSLTQQNLSLELYDSSGSVQLASSDSSGIGQTESISGFSLSGSGPYVVRVAGGGASLPQIYELEIGFSLPVVIPLVSALDFNFNENAGTIAMPVTLSEATTVPVTVSWSTFDISANSADYTGGSGSLVFSPGETAKTVDLDGKEDALDEADETFRVRLASPQNATMGDEEGTVTIVDDDPLPLVSVVPDPGVVSETAGTVDISFALDTESGRSVSFDYLSVPGSATGGADFSAISGSVTLPAGQTSVVVSVPILDDAEAEAAETFSINISNPVNVNPGSSSAVTIEDDDAPALFAKSSGALAPDPLSGGVKVTWDAVPGRTYCIEESDDLLNWTPVPGAENLSVESAQEEFTDTRLRAGARRFYRLVDKG